MNNENILGSFEGYLKGNIFKNEYVPYNNYKIQKLVPNSEKSEALLNLNQIGFMVHDLRLYLDINPDNKEYIDLYNKYIKKYNELLKEYESRFGIICPNTLSNNNYFTWEEEKFPWEVGNV